MKPAVGALEFYDMKGKPIEKIEYDDVQEFKDALESEFNNGRLVTAVVYRQPGRKSAIDAQWIMDHVCSLSIHYRTAWTPDVKREEMER